MDPMSIASLLQLMPKPNIGKIGTGIKALSSLGKAGYGAYQLANNERPEDFTYQLPTEVLESLNIAKSRLNNPLPGADLERERIAQTTAKGIQTLNQRGGASGAALGAATELLAKEYQSLNDLSIREANATLAAEQNVQGQLGNVAQYRDREFDFNVRRPYEQALAEFFATRNAGTANLFGGLNELGNTAEQYFQNQMLLDELGYGKSTSNPLGSLSSGGYGSTFTPMAKGGGTGITSDQILPEMSRMLLSIR